MTHLQAAVELLHEAVVQDGHDANRNYCIQRAQAHALLGIAELLGKQYNYTVLRDQGRDMDESTREAFQRSLGIRSLG